MSLAKVLEKYKDKKLYKRGQYEFKFDFFKELFDPAGIIDYNRRKTIFINAVLEEENLPYVVRSTTDEKGENYWIVLSLDEFEIAE